MCDPFVSPIFGLKDVFILPHCFLLPRPPIAGKSNLLLRDGSLSTACGLDIPRGSPASAASFASAGARSRVLYPESYPRLLLDYVTSCISFLYPSARLPPVLDSRESYCFDLISNAPPPDSYLSSSSSSSSSPGTRLTHRVSPLSTTSPLRAVR